MFGWFKCQCTPAWKQECICTTTSLWVLIKSNSIQVQGAKIGKFECVCNQACIVDVRTRPVGVRSDNEFADGRVKWRLEIVQMSLSGTFWRNFKWLKLYYYEIWPYYYLTLLTQFQMVETILLWKGFWPWTFGFRYMIWPILLPRLDYKFNVVYLKHCNHNGYLENYIMRCI